MMNYFEKRKRTKDLARFAETVGYVMLLNEFMANLQLIAPAIELVPEYIESKELLTKMNGYIRTKDFDIDKAIEDLYKLKCTQAAIINFIKTLPVETVMKIKDILPR